MNEPVKVPSRLFNLFPHLIVAVEVEDVRHEVERILVVLHLGIEAGQVEAIREVLLIDLAKVLVAAGGDELEIPTSAFSTCADGNMANREPRRPPDTT